MKWNDDKKALLQAYLNQGLTYAEIAKKLSLSYDQIKHAIRRYSLKITDTESSLFVKPKNQLKRDDVTQLARLIGEKLYENYKVIKLQEPNPIKTKGKREEISILDISDVHIGMINEVFDSDAGKKVITYNMDIFKNELEVIPSSKLHIEIIWS